MAATPHKKRSTLTYADRVIRALSEYQSAHKKHSVHLATIRAQVRRDADSDKEQLGRQWSHWVTRALNQLVARGMVESPQLNHYALTSQTKKTLSVVRRQTLTAAPGTPSRPGHVWKAVTNTPLEASRGTKRRRVMGGADHTYDAHLHTPTQSISVQHHRRSLSHKRAQGSSIKDLRKLTKAQLLEALQATEDDESEDIIRLQEELSVLRQELEKARTCETTGTALQHTFPSRPLTPLTPLPVRDSPSPFPARLGASKTVTRTESGTLIHEYSKQPTPAPSDCGAEVEDPFQAYPVDRSPRATSTVHPFTSATPAHTPPHEEVGLQATSDADVSRAALVSEAEELRILRDTYQRLLNEHTTAMETISRYETTISTLQATVAEKSSILSAKQAELSVACAKLSGFEGDIACSTQAVHDGAVTLADLRKAVQEKELAVNALVLEKADQDAKLLETEEALKMLRAEWELRDAQLAKGHGELEEERAKTGDLQALLDATTVQLATAEGEIASLSTRLASAGAALRTMSEERMEAVARYESARDDYATKEVTMTTLRQELADARQTASHWEASQRELATRLSRAEEELALVHQQLQHEVSQNALLVQRNDEAAQEVQELTARLEISREQIESVKQELCDKQVAMRDLQECLVTAEVEVTNLSGQTVRLTQDKLQLEHVLRDVKESLAVAEVEVAQSKDRLRAEEEARASLQVQLATLAAENADLSSSVSTAAMEAVALRSQLEGALASEHKIHEQLTDLQRCTDAASQAADAQISTLEASLRDTVTQVTTLQSQLQTSEATYEERRAMFEATLQTEKEYRKPLEERVISTSAENEDLRSQVQACRQVKVQDEETIRRLKHLLARHEAFLKDQLEDITRESQLIHTADSPLALSF